MNARNYLALMVWAIDRDLLDVPVAKAVELFYNDAVRCYRSYNDPSDILLYCKHAVSMDSVEFFTDYVLCCARVDLLNNNRTYGKYNSRIMNYSMAGN